MKTLEIELLEEFPGYGVTKDGRVWTMKKRGLGSKLPRLNWKQLKGSPKDREYSYLFVNLKNKSGNFVKRAIHRLVYEAWVGEIGAGLQINHLDGDKTNNTIENLEVVSSAGNMLHASVTGLLATAENGRSRSGERMSKDQIAIVKAAYGKVTIQAMMKAFGVSSSTIRKALRS
jgi:hypothetical protein